MFRNWLIALDDESPISANLRNGHRFINKEYSIKMMSFRATIAYAQSGQYHVLNMVSESKCFYVLSISLMFIILNMISEYDEVEKNLNYYKIYINM